MFKIKRGGRLIPYFSFRSYLHTIITISSILKFKRLNIDFGNSLRKTEKLLLQLWHWKSQKKLVWFNVQPGVVQRHLLLLFLLYLWNSLTFTDSPERYLGKKMVTLFASKLSNFRSHWVLKLIWIISNSIILFFFSSCESQFK